MPKSANGTGNSPPETARAAALARARRLARLTDSAIRVPGTPIRVGLDALIGLVPGAGDVLGALIALYLPWTALRLGAPRALIGRMLANVALDLVAGAVPILGDIADVALRANTRNLELLEQWAAPRPADPPSPPRLPALALVALLATLAAVVALAVYLRSAP